MPDSTQSYILKRSARTRRLILRIYPDMRIVVSAPRLVPKFLIDRFVGQKSQWIDEVLTKMKLVPTVEIPKRKTPAQKRKEFLQYKEQARALAKERLEYFNQFYGYRYKNITIRNQSTRWGSCSKAGNLNFNYKLALLPTHLSDYIVVHELCHLGEFNHSRNFWKLVERTMPDWKVYRKELHKIALL